MNRVIKITLLLLLSTTVALAQGSVKGKVLDKKSNIGLEFINIAIRKEGNDKIFKGAITDTEGNFMIDNASQRFLFVDCQLYGLQRLG